MRYPLSDSQQVATVSCGIELLSLKIDVVLCYVNYEQCCSLKVIFWFVRINSHIMHIHGHTMRWCVCNWESSRDLCNMSYDPNATHWIKGNMLQQNKHPNVTKSAWYEYNILIQDFQIRIWNFHFTYYFARHTFRTIIYQLQSNISGFIFAMLSWPPCKSWLWDNVLC